MTKGGPHLRVSSPPSGLSTLMTSAPRSASNCPAQGPARMRASSTTRTPFSGGSAINHQKRVGTAASINPGCRCHGPCGGPAMSAFEHAIGPGSEIVHDDIAVHLVQAFVAGVGVNL